MQIQREEVTLFPALLGDDRVPPLLSPARDAALLTVIPTTGPQDAATEDLVRSLRDDVIPAANEGTGSEVHVGGATALAIASTSNIAERIPLLILGVVALSMLLLLLGFPSLAIPLTAAVTDLLSGGASYGGGGADAAGRLGRAADRHRHQDADACLHPGADVRRPDRAVDGL